MHVELADLLRCRVAHAETTLVLMAERTHERVVLDGVLGCPVCGAEYVIEAGVVYFGTPHIAATAESPASDMEGAAMRAAALLNVVDRTSTVGFVGTALALVRAVQDIVPARCLVFDAPDAANAVTWHARGEAPMAVIALDRGALPLAAGTLSGLWVAQGEPAELLPALRARGRIAAPRAIALPPGVAELARDDEGWVAERTAETTAAPASLVQLRRRR